ncbi:MAG: hypothetical protein ABSF46_23380 [Terriglobia bacterium]|jgi:D-alanyl-lipoteichoic acid acyltransferase DltB (MBOAT superfamily)
MRIIPQLDTYPKLVAFAETPAGKVAAVATFAVLLRLARMPFSGIRTPVVEMAAIVGILSFFPQHRRLLVSAATLYWLVFHAEASLKLDFVRWVASSQGFPSGATLTVTAVVALLAVFCALGLYLKVVGQRRHNLFGRRPVLLLVGSYVCLLVATKITPHGLPRVGVWMLLAITCNYLWFFAYAVADYTSKAPDPYRYQIGTFLPFWVGDRVSPTPIGKGAAFLRRVEARTADDLTVTQLKAIKLLMWLVILNVVQTALYSFVYGELPDRLAGFWKTHHVPFPHLTVPTLDKALHQAATGQSVPVYLAWAILLSHFSLAVLRATIGGNTVVACCRMAGFRILRNTFKPLYSANIAEFWNRYYFYFKELLVDFFFFPVYIRYFKKYRRLRLAAATLAAATFGNMLYHFCRDIHYVFQLGLWRAIAGFRVYAVYSLALGVGIVISQLRGKKVEHASLPFYRRVLACVGVVGFFCLLEVFDYEGRTDTLRTHFAFFWNLFPLVR